MSVKKKETSIEIRKLIVDYRKSGKSYSEISEIVKKPKSTVRDIIKHFDKYNKLEKCKRTGRPKLLSDREERWIVHQIKRDPFTSAPFLKEEVQKRFNINVSTSTIRNVLRRCGFHGRVARKKPYISKKNRIARLKFSASYINKPLSFWHEVIFVDETKINFCGKDGNVIVWREANKEYDFQNTLATTKHGGGSIMLWGSMGANGVGKLHFIDGKMDKSAYLDILKRKLKKSAKKLGILHNFKLYQDNDPKHSSYVCRLWALYNCPGVIKTPAQSPDLNPIEHLWSTLKNRLSKTQLKHTTRTKKNLKKLKKLIRNEWKNIPDNYCQKLVDSMPNRLREVLKRRGRSTKY